MRAAVGNIKGQWFLLALSMESYLNTFGTCNAHTTRGELNKRTVLRKGCQNNQNTWHIEGPKSVTVADLDCWLIGWPAASLAGWLVGCWLAASLPGWLAGCCLPGWLARCWLAGWLAEKNDPLQNYCTQMEMQFPLSLVAHTQSKSNFNT